MWIFKKKEVIFWCYFKTDKTCHYKMILKRDGKTSLLDFMDWTSECVKSIGADCVIENMGIIK